MKRSLVTLLSLFLFSGCHKAGFDFTPPTPPTALAASSDLSDDSVAMWWKRFRDPVLDALVAKALKDNIDIQTAALRIIRSRAALGVAEGYRYPQAQYVSANAALSYKNDRDIQTATVAFDTAWEADVWGLYARGIEAAEATLLASIASYRDIVGSIVAETARQYVIYRTAQERLVYAYRNAAIQSRIVRMTEVQFNSGNVSELDMQQARTQWHTTRSAVFAIRQEMVRARNALALLLGTDPHTAEKLLYDRRIARMIETSETLTRRNDATLPKRTDTLLDVAFVPEITLEPNLRLDAALLARRPDIKAAEHLAHAAAAEVGVAEAELYPHFSLFGTLSFAPNNTFGSWINGKEALGVSIGPSFRWNIFHYGRIKNTIRLKDALFEEKLALYNKTVLKALGEVSDAAEGYRLTQRQMKENKAALEATLRAFNLSATQYGDGLVGYQRLLTSIEQLTRTQDLYAQLKGLRAQQAILFFKAVGGGWQHGAGKPLLSRATRHRMRARTDWDGTLDAVVPKAEKGATR